MKVLISAYACEPDKGSEPEVGWGWAREMAKEHEVWVLTRANNRESIERALSATERARMNWIYYDLATPLRFWKKGQRGINPYYYLWQVGAGRVARKLHAKYGFDLAHHVTFGKYWLPSHLVSLGIPFIFGPVGGGESAPAAFHRTYGRAGQRFEFLRDWARNLAHWDPLLRRCLKEAALVLAATEETKAVLLKQGCRRVEVLPQMGISAKRLDYFTNFPIRQEAPFRLISMGRLLHWKGAFLGLMAFARLVRDRPQAEYWIVGSGPEEGRLRRLAAQLGVTNQVKFWGHLPTLEDVYDKLRQSDVLVHAALHEAFGNVCLEALSAGRPVLCLDRGGPALQVTRECGFAVSSQSQETAVAGLANAMVRLHDDFNLRASMSEAARQRARSTFSWETLGRSMNEFYSVATAEFKQTSLSPPHKASTPWIQTWIGRTAKILNRIISLRGLTAMVLMLLLVGAVSFFSLTHVRHVARSIVDDTLPGLSFGGRITAYLADANRTLLFVIDDDAQHRAELRSEINMLSDRTTGYLQTYGESVFSKEDRTNFNTLVTERKAYIALRNHVLDLASAGKKDEAITLFSHDLMAAHTRVKSAGDNLVAYNVREGKERSRAIMIACTITQIAVALIGVIVFVLGFFIGLFR